MAEKELVFIKMVKEEAEKAGSTEAIKNLLQTMEDVDQGKIYASEFNRVMAVIECESCHKQISEEIDDRKICARCLKEEKLEAVRKQAQIITEIKWQGLVGALNTEAGKEIYTLFSEFGDWGQDNSFIKRVDGDDYAKISRESFYTKSYRASKYALRIYTPDFEVNADRLQRDFGAKNVAVHLHKKCNELLKMIQDNRSRRKAKVDAKASLADKIKATFPKATNLETVVYKTGRNSYSEGSSIKFMAGNVWFTTYSCEEFQTTGINKKFDVASAKALVDLVS